MRFGTPLAMDGDRWSCMKSIKCFLILELSELSKHFQQQTYKRRIGVYVLNQMQKHYLLYEEHRQTSVAEAKWEKYVYSQWRRSCYFEVSGDQGIDRGVFSLANTIDQLKWELAFEIAKREAFETLAQLKEYFLAEKLPGLFINKKNDV